MKANTEDKPIKADYADDRALIELPGYPSYPKEEDIFNRYREEQDLNPEDISEAKASNSETNFSVVNCMNESTDVSGDDLDVPGSELDDALEEVGSEDEENNYYSIGGDDHNDLEEDKGE